MSRFKFRKNQIKFLGRYIILIENDNKIFLQLIDYNL